MNGQLTLNFNFHNENNFDNFVIGQNLELVSTLKNFITADEWDCMLIYGPTSIGKTHLLQAASSKAITDGKSVFYFEFNTIDARLLDGLEQFDLIVLDDIENMFGKADCEEALFDCYNRLQAANKRLILSTKSAPNEFKIDLPDLRSRLLASIIYQVKALNDDDKVAALQLRANSRGLALPDDVAQYMIHHYSRDFANLLLALEQLDQESLKNKRRLTIPFVKEVI